GRGISPYELAYCGRGFSRGARDVRRGARRDPGGTLRGALDPSWAVLPISRRPDRAHAGPATASAALAGRDLTGGRGRGRRARRQHRRDRTERSDERGRRALLRGVEQEIGREGADGGHPAPRVRGRDRRRGDRRRARGLPGLVRQPDEPLASVQHGARPVLAETLERALTIDAAIVGSPATVRAEVERHLAATGCNYFVGRFMYGNLSYEQASRSLAFWSTEVMPRFLSAEWGDPPQTPPALNQPT